MRVVVALVVGAVLALVALWSDGRTPARVDVLEDEISSAVRRGAEVFVRYHTIETGQPDQVAHMLIRHPGEGGWAEIYADWE